MADLRLYCARNDIQRDRGEMRFDLKGRREFRSVTPKEPVPVELKVGVLMLRHALGFGSLVAVVSWLGGSCSGRGFIG